MGFNAKDAIVEINRKHYLKLTELIGTDAASKRLRKWLENQIRKEEKAALSPTESYPTINKTDAEVILLHLNFTVQARFKLTKAIKTAIEARLSEGHSVQDFYHVHEVKRKLWYNDPKMRQYLRPSTLYRPSHFQEYLQEWEWMADEKAAGRGTDSKSLAEMITEKKAKAEAERTENERLRAEVMAIPWYSFPLFAEFVKHVPKMPDSKGIEEYEATCPPEVIQMRRINGIYMKAIQNKIPAEYQQQWENILRLAGKI